jgi:hypothetical protein
MTYTFAGLALHEMPCYHRPEAYLDAYIAEGRHRER